MLFLNYKWFKIKASVVHHPVIQKEVDELLPRVPLNHLLVVLAFTLMSLQLCV